MPFYLGVPCLCCLFLVYTMYGFNVMRVYVNLDVQDIRAQSNAILGTQTVRVTGGKK